MGRRTDPGGRWNVQLDVSHDTSAFEVEAELDGDLRITAACADRIGRTIDRHGFAIVPGCLSDAECAAGRALVADTLADADRERSSFASQTDIAYGRRDFCPLPSSPEVLGFFSALVRRCERVLTPYSSLRRSVLEISTLTSHAGCSHQYVHSDPGGVLCVFAAVSDVSRAQGGTVFAPGTHPYIGSELGHGRRAALLSRLFQIQCNLRIFAYNLRKLFGLWRSGEPRITARELRDRVFSRRRDGHQPNLWLFLTSPSSVFNLYKIAFHTRGLIRMWRHGSEAAAAFRLVQAAPRRGTVLIYRSDMLHAGPDNRSDEPRCFLNINLARDVVHPEALKAGYSPHSSLRERPMTVGELIAWQPGAEARTR